VLSEPEGTQAMKVYPRMSKLKTIVKESKPEVQVSREADSPDVAPRQKFNWKLFKKNEPEGEPTPAEILSEMGLQLRQLRHAQSLSVEEVSMVTLIAPRVLSAIENGDLQQLPEPIYIQGFIRRFADALGLDGTQFASQFPLVAESKPKSSSWQAAPEAQLRPVHLYLLYIGLVFFSVRSLSHSIQRVAVAPNLQNVPQTTASQSPAATRVSNTSGPQAKTSVTASVPKSGKKVRVGITVTEASWITVEADGKLAFEGMLSEGTHTWEANEQLTISAGNAGGVLITHNGSQAEKMGEPGAVEEVTFTAEKKS
jgi:cytoskeletal protein RodZ